MGFRRPRIDPKSIKIHTWKPRCPIEWPRGPQDHQNGVPRVPKWCRRVLQGHPMVPKWHLQASQKAGLGTQIDHVQQSVTPASSANPPSPASHQLTVYWRGWRQGRSLKISFQFGIYIKPYQTLPGTTKSTQCVSKSLQKILIHERCSHIYGFLTSSQFVSPLTHTTP